MRSRKPPARGAGTRGSRSAANASSGIRPAFAGERSNKYRCSASTPAGPASSRARARSSSPRILSEKYAPSISTARSGDASGSTSATSSLRLNSAPSLSSAAATASGSTRCAERASRPPRYATPSPRKSRSTTPSHSSVETCAAARSTHANARSSSGVHASSRNRVESRTASAIRPRASAETSDAIVSYRRRRARRRAGSAPGSIVRRTTYPKCVSSGSMALGGGSHPRRDDRAAQTAHARDSVSAKRLRAFVQRSSSSTFTTGSRRQTSATFGSRMSSDVSRSTRPRLAARARHPPISFARLAYATRTGGGAGACSSR